MKEEWVGGGSMQYELVTRSVINCTILLEVLYYATYGRRPSQRKAAFSSRRGPVMLSQPFKT